MADNPYANVEVRRPDYNRFREEPEVRIGRSTFNRSHGRKMTFDASYLYPILVDEVLPGDTFTCKLNGFARIFSPLDAPVMDNIELETFFFFVPCRLVWQNWEYFQGEHDDAGAQDTTYTVPVMNSGLTVDHDGSGYTVTALAAYMGLPEGLDSSQINVNALPFRAYKLIYNDWFRDQNLTAETGGWTVGNGPDTVSNYALRKSAKKHDYFTSCLPYLQKGTAQTAAVSLAGTFGSDEGAYVRGSLAAGENLSIYSDTLTGWYDIDTDAARADLSVTGGAQGDGLYIAASDLTVDINTLRQATMIQRLLERDARGGTRYVEMIKSHFGVTSPDFRIQRPEYLGGGRSWINISPVANTSGVDSTVSVSGSDEPQGLLRGTGAGTLSGHGWAKSFVEHGYIIGLIRARGDVTYFQGLDKLWSRSTRYDFYIPALAHLGEQSVLNKEIWVSNATATDDAVFGYQERWAEYRYKKSEIVGMFNPDVSGAYSHWHLAEDFAALPTLNTAFIEDGTPMSRVTTTDTAGDFLLDVWFDYKCARPMPVRSIPSIIPRF